MSDTLKPCPFCGVVPVCRRYTGPDSMLWQVKCEEDECNVKASSGPWTSESATLEQWNTRADALTETQSAVLKAAFAWMTAVKGKVLHGRGSQIEVVLYNAVVANLDKELGV